MNAAVEMGVTMTAAVSVSAIVAFALAVGLPPAKAPAAEACCSCTTEIHYSPEENLEAIDVEAIDQAGDTIDVAAYVMTDRAIVEALKLAGERGVRVRLWRDAEMAAELSVPDVVSLLANDHPGLEVRDKPRGELMHLKGFCIDGRVLRTGSANFSRSGETRQDNDLVLVRSSAACAKFEAKFAKAWEGK
jgi:phosphatidylserine/phosphatidylglycerophosphate/cardiolipin synthase-like enzyme